MRKRILIATLLVFAVVMNGMAQDRTVTGKITAPDGTTLAGVNIVLQGTGTGTITDIDGNYSVAVPDDGASLVFSYIGFTTQVVEVGSQSTIDLELAEDLTQMSEVVVTALGIERSERAPTMTWPWGPVTSTSRRTSRTSNSSSTRAAGSSWAPATMAQRVRSVQTMAGRPACGFPAVANDCTWASFRAQA